MEDMKADVDPLPLVPAMWMGRNFLKSEGYKILDGGKRKDSVVYEIETESKSKCCGKEKKENVYWVYRKRVAHLITNSLCEVNHLRNRQ
jgi:hypothetical protein